MRRPWRPTCRWRGAWSIKSCSRKIPTRTCPVSRSPGARIAQDRVEFIVFDGLDHPPGYGRGYGEFKLVDYVMSHSRVIDAHRESAAVWKVTGRYLVRNLERIIRRAPSGFDVYCNCRNRPQRWADMFLVAWSSRGHRSVIRDCYHGLNEEGARASAEVRFRELIDAAPAALRVARRFTVTPLVEGVRGMDNQSYSRGKNLLKFYARFRGAFRGPLAVDIIPLQPRACTRCTGASIARPKKWR